MTNQLTSIAQQLQALLSAVAPVAVAIVVSQEAAVVSAVVALAAPCRDAELTHPVWRNCTLTSLFRRYARGEIAGVIFAS
jgi:hypothetical protein